MVFCPALPLIHLCIFAYLCCSITVYFFSNLSFTYISFNGNVLSSICISHFINLIIENHAPFAHTKLLYTNCCDSTLPFLSFYPFISSIFLLPSYFGYSLFILHTLLCCFHFFSFSVPWLLTLILFPRGSHVTLFLVSYPFLLDHLQIERSGSSPLLF